MAIWIDVLRHGRALPADVAGDAARPLSPEGAEEVARLGARLRALDAGPTRAFASPLVRARQTAEIVCRACVPPREIESLPELAPDVEPATLVARLASELERGDRALTVGHQPLLGEFVRLLTGESRGIRPATLVRIVCEIRIAPGSGRIETVLEPPDFG
jgi:phosphohistidine phosphatase